MQICIYIYTCIYIYIYVYIYIYICLCLCLCISVWYIWCMLFCVPNPPWCWLEIHVLQISHIIFCWSLTGTYLSYLIIAETAVWSWPHILVTVEILLLSLPSLGISMDLDRAQAPPEDERQRPAAVLQGMEWLQRPAAHSCETTRQKDTTWRQKWILLSELDTCFSTWNSVSVVGWFWMILVQSHPAQRCLNSVGEEVDGARPHLTILGVKFSGQRLGDRVNCMA